MIVCIVLRAAAIETQSRIGEKARFDCASYRKNLMKNARSLWEILLNVLSFFDDGC